MSYLLTFLAGAVSITTLISAMERREYKKGLGWVIACLALAFLLHHNGL